MELFKPSEQLEGLTIYTFTGKNQMRIPKLSMPLPVGFQASFGLAIICSELPGINVRCAPRRRNRLRGKAGFGLWANGKIRKAGRKGLASRVSGLGRISRIGRTERMGMGMVLEGAGRTALGDSMACHRVPKRRLVAAVQNFGSPGANHRGRLLAPRRGAGGLGEFTGGGRCARPPATVGQPFRLAGGKIQGGDWVTCPPVPKR